MPIPDRIFRDSEWSTTGLPAEAIVVLFVLAVNPAAASEGSKGTGVTEVPPDPAVECPRITCIRSISSSESPTSDD